MTKKKEKIKVTRLRAERLSRGYTLAQVGDAVGVTKEAIKTYELLQRTPSLQVYRRLEAFFKVSPGMDLLEVIQIDGDGVFHSIKSL
ncbi:MULTISPECIES: helix-turn-helix domain-containing protein [unclassified Emergencia]|jgi:transcriptional regulator with XRE-family HTH domain|uniref:helix-turn-helix domain-containing protein n=1 Tax=unclassified Emergencia TaxID=2642996 RepID=UPI0013797E7C|nr:helix-turn-helix transcriptional regulator [Emergencia sp. 1XD21-10]NCF00625.1 XRE family transcriptional regulator [Emergencia sp. 1XD21-10]